eukprot:7789490-Pyramimonas_sp.AAC.1
MMQRRHILLELQKARRDDNREMVLNQWRQSMSGPEWEVCTQSGSVTKGKSPKVERGKSPKVESAWRGVSAVVGLGLDEEDVGPDLRVRVRVRVQVSSCGCGSRSPRAGANRAGAGVGAGAGA